MRTGPRLLLCLVPFVVLATLNSGGYRYGASDQAFYLPAIDQQIDPELFPRDREVLGAQTGLTLVDEVIAGIVRSTGMPVPTLFLLLYLAALALFAGGAWQIGSRFFATTWGSAAFLAALTLRHAIARSGTNTLEGYFHPRTLAYALGALAVAAFLRRRLAAVTALLAVGILIHPTTTVWFAAWLGTAAIIADRPLRPWLVGIAAAAALTGAWAVAAGPLAGRLVPMDAEWRALLATKDYLFPLGWPAYAWLVNLAYFPLIFWLHRERRARGLADDRERALVIGSLALAAIFAAALMLHMAGTALAFQLQPARVFWMFDFLAVLHVVWWLAENRPAPRRAVVVAAVIALLATARGIYVLIEAERPAVQVTLPDDDWGRAMAWARTTSRTSGWIAHPMHAVLYGSSLRVAGQRDVFVEAVKDAALGMYNRDTAVRTWERVRALDDFDAMTSERARQLASAYGMDFLITESTLDLPVAFESGALRVYRLR